MKEEETNNISLVEKILNTMFESIETKDEFDEASIKKIKELISKDELHKFKKISDAIKPNEGEDNETD
ncbi:MAG: hypothetical protein JSW07_04425 [bacterium]|nr:MAG: hypothetical protein JSW07_04425 [bacterium]